MRRTLLSLAVLGLTAVVPTSASAAGFSLGVAAAEVSPSSALLWAHATSSGRTTLEVAKSRSFGRLEKTRNVSAAKSHDNTVQTKVTGLKANTTYFFRWRQGTKRSKVGTFKTAPSPSSNATIKFAWSGDEDAQPAAGSTKPFYNRFEVFKRMQSERNAFNVNLGDTIYSDTEVGSTLANGQFKPSAPTALTLKAKWQKYRQNLALANLSNLRGSAAMYNHWDDHEFINDFSKAENGAAIYKAGVAAFRDYQPVTYSSSKGIYRSFRWGTNLEVFFLDERSFRSAKASANHQCDDRNGNPDLGPTAPQSARNTFAVVYPPLGDPPKQGCVQTINDPNRTFLGSAQLARFTAAVKQSTATFKVIMNELPIQQFYANPYDRWEGYEAERRRLMDFLSTNAVKNVVFLSTDVHANYDNTIKFSTLGESGPTVDTGVLDLVTGPVATMTGHKEVARVFGSEGNADLFRSVVLHGGPPTGVAMKCSQDNVFSYGQVSVTSTTLTVTPKDINGRPVKEAPADGGAQCGPYVIPKQ
jgi:phosphodiesterase/alkaline phosphatase D-like protein